MRKKEKSSYASDGCETVRGSGRVCVRESEWTLSFIGLIFGKIVIPALPLRQSNMFQPIRVDAFFRPCVCVYLYRRL